MVGFRIRDGCEELLANLPVEHQLILWSVSNRNYLNKVLSYGLGQYFSETYSWDEIASSWKDIRRIKADYLIDDSEHHCLEAEKHGLHPSYIIVPAFGCSRDVEAPLLWKQMIEVRLLKK